MQLVGFARRGGPGFAYGTHHQEPGHYSSVLCPETTGSRSGNCSYQPDFHANACFTSISQQNRYKWIASGSPRGMVQKPSRARPHLKKRIPDNPYARIQIAEIPIIKLIRVTKRMTDVCSFVRRCGKHLIPKLRRRFWSGDWRGLQSR